MLEFTEYTKIFISLFAIVDPIGMIPVIILFTAGMTTSQRNRSKQDDDGNHPVYCGYDNISA